MLFQCEAKAKQHPNHMVSHGYHMTTTFRSNAWLDALQTVITE